MGLDAAQLINEQPVICFQSSSIRPALRLWPGQQANETVYFLLLWSTLQALLDHSMLSGFPCLHHNSSPIPTLFMLTTRKWPGPCFRKWAWEKLWICSAWVQRNSCLNFNSGLVTVLTYSGTLTFSLASFFGRSRDIQTSTSWLVFTPRSMLLWSFHE